MSDEQTPPPPSLRLKPRLKPPEGETPAAIPDTPPPVAAAPVENAAPAGDSAGKIRLKPRLTPASPEATAAVAPVSAPAPEAVRENSPAPIASPEPPPAVASSAAPAVEGAPRIRLKPRVAEPAPSPAASVPPAAPAPVQPEAPVLPPPPPPVPTEPAAPVAGGEAPKFKFKPKAPAAPPPPAAGVAAASDAAAPALPPPPPPSPAAALPPPPGVAPKAPQFPPPPGMGGAPKVPPPFPVVAPPKTGKTNPPIPHLSAKEEPAVAEPEPRPTKAPLWKNKIIQSAGAGLLVVIAAAGWFFLRPAPPPPPVARPAPRPATPPAPVDKSAIVAKPAPTTPGLSETQNAIAHAPVNAINKAQDVVAKREGSGQGRDAVGAIVDGGSLAEKPAAKPAPAPQAVQTSSAIAPGVSATNDNVSAVAEASPAFRSFVANAKISGVFPTATPPRLLLNGRLARAGDIVDGGLNITFDSIDSDKKLILFKDKSGATVTRRY